MPAPRVSVIIIFLDPGRYIAEAIESVVTQTMPDWELILVDDGSRDESTLIAKEWVARRPGQVRYVEHPGHANRGTSVSRNLGLREARGRYVAFLDADDVYLPERMAKHVAILDEWPQVAMVQSDQIYWYCWSDHRGCWHEELCRRPPLYLGDCIIRPPDGLLTLFGAPDAFTAPCSFTIRREVALELGGFEETFHTLYEDQVFLTKVYAHTIVYALQEYLARYRVHAGGTFLRAVANVRGTQSAFFEATRLLREWQTEYVGSLPERQPLVQELLSVNRRRSEERRSIRVQALATFGRQSAHRLMRRFLPMAVYRRTLHRRQDWSANRTRLQHAWLCKIISDGRLARRRIEPSRTGE